MNSKTIKKLLEKYNIKYEFNNFNFFTINHCIQHDDDYKKFTVIQNITFQIEFFGFTGWTIEYIVCDLTRNIKDEYQNWFSRCDALGDTFTEKKLKEIIKGES